MTPALPIPFCTGDRLWFRASLALVLAAIGLARPLNAQSGTTAIQDSPQELGSAELELQAVDTEVNTIRVGPGYSGSEFNATPYTGKESREGRLTLTYPVSPFQAAGELRLVIAPDITSGTAATPSPLMFDGARFSPGRPLSIFYKFNTYRIAYDTTVWRGGGCSLSLGATLALRDAELKLDQAGVTRSYRNYGPVPLLYASFSETLGSNFRAVLQFDGFPAPGGGGLFDGSARLECCFFRRCSGFVGLREQFGGASQPEVYNCLRQTAGVAGIRIGL